MPLPGMCRCSPSTIGAVPSPSPRRRSLRLELNPGANPGGHGIGAAASWPDRPIRSASGRRRSGERVHRRRSEAAAGAPAAGAWRPAWRAAGGPMRQIQGKFSLRTPPSWSSSRPSSPKPGPRPGRPDPAGARLSARSDANPARPGAQVDRQRRLTPLSARSASIASVAKMRNPAGRAAEPLAGEAERRGEKEPADPTGAADEPGHHPDLRPKRCGTSWNTAPLAAPSASIARMNSPSATPGWSSRCRPPPPNRGDQIDDGQSLNATDRIGERAADRPDQRTREHARGGVNPRDRCHAETVDEVEGERGRGGRRSRRK